MTKPSIGLIFHGIGDPKRELEPGEAPYWISEAQFENILDQVVDQRDQATFHITFDDGNVSDHDIGLPALLERGLTARFFVLSGRVGHVGSVSQEHLQSLIEAGMTIGSHGIDHLPWPTLPQEHLEQELNGSKARLEEFCGQPISEAGIPFGRYDKRVLSALRNAGFKTVWSSDAGKSNDKSYVRARTSFRRNMDRNEISRVLSGEISPLRRVKRLLGMTRRRFFVTG